MDQEEEGDVTCSLWDLGDVHRRQCAWRRKRGALRDTKADCAYQACCHGHIAKDGRARKVAEGAQECKAQNDGKE